MINYFWITLYHVQNFTIQPSRFPVHCGSAADVTYSTSREVLTPLQPSSMKNRCLQPMYAIFNTTPIQTRFFSFLTNMRRLTLSSKCEHTSALRHLYGLLLAVLEKRYTDLDKLYHSLSSSSVLRHLQLQDTCDVLPSTLAHMLILWKFLLCHLKMITYLKHPCVKLDI